LVYSSANANARSRREVSAFDDALAMTTLTPLPGARRTTQIASEPRCRLLNGAQGGTSARGDARAVNARIAPAEVVPYRPSIMVHTFGPLFASSLPPKKTHWPFRDKTRGGARRVEGWTASRFSPRSRGFIRLASEVCLHVDTRFVRWTVP
jgi:hypothetical protein